MYQKTIQTTVPNCTSDGTEEHSYVNIGASVATIVDIKGILVTSANKCMPLNFTGVNAKTETGNIPQVRVSANNNSATSNANTVDIMNNRISYSGYTIFITLQYTKA